MNDRAIPPLTGKVVTVLGGSGFVGRHLAQELLARGARLRIASRNPEKAYRVKPLGNLGQVAFTRVDVTRPETLGAALAGTDAVVYLVGAFSGNLDALQGKGVGKVAAAAKQAGVQDTPDGLWEFFINRVRALLHLCICMSPVGDAMRNRCRKFPVIKSHTAAQPLDH